MSISIDSSTAGKTKSRNLQNCYRYQVNDIHDFASSYAFLAMGICADGVSVMCS